MIRDLQQRESYVRPEHSATQYAKYALCRTDDKFPDPEEIRALTRNMKREHWLPSPPWIRGEECVKQYIRAWGYVSSRELEHLGITWKFLANMQSRGQLVSEHHQTRGYKNTFYTLPNE